MEFNIEIRAGRVPEFTKDEILEYVLNRAIWRRTHPVEELGIYLNTYSHPVGTPYYAQMWLYNDYQATYDRFAGDVYITRLDNSSPGRLQDSLIMPMSEEMYNRYLFVIRNGLRENTTPGVRELADQCLDSMVMADFFEHVLLSADPADDIFIPRNHVGGAEHTEWIDEYNEEELRWLDDKENEDPEIRKMWTLEFIAEEEDWP